MHRSIKALLSCLLAWVIATTSFASSAFAGQLSALPHFNIGTSIPTAFLSSGTVKQTGKVILRVTPKVADKLVKKYGPRLVKVFPVLGTTITVIEITVDIYNDIQQILAEESEQPA